jgi:hypothetical protein
VLGLREPEDYSDKDRRARGLLTEFEAVEYIGRQGFNRETEAPGIVSSLRARPGEPWESGPASMTYRPLPGRDDDGYWVVPPETVRF